MTKKNMSACPKCGKVSSDEDVRKNMLETRRGKSSTENFCDYCGKFENSSHLSQ